MERGAGQRNSDAPLPDALTERVLPLHDVVEVVACARVAVAVSNCTMVHTVYELCKT